MICWKCGHSKEEHRDDYLTIGGCSQCLSSSATRLGFWKHEFEDNLSYVERKAKEKKLV